MENADGNVRKRAGIAAVSAAVFVLLAVGRVSAQDDGIRYYTVNPDRATVSKIVRSPQSDAVISDIKCTDSETRVVVSVPIGSDGHWLCFSPGMLIRDCENGRAVYLKEIAGGFPADQVLLVRGMAGKMVDFTLVFPPLPAGAREIEIMEDMKMSGPTPSNGVPWYWKIDLADYGKPVPAVSGNRAPVTVTRVDRARCHYVTRLAPITGTWPSQLLKKVEVTDKGTVVTVITHRSKPEREVRVDTRIIDCATGDVYPASGLNHRLQLGQRYRKLGRIRRVKVYFPALSSKVRRIDIIEGNGEAGWKWENVQIKNY